MNIWQRKLLAYLHDPPSKSLNIREHSERSVQAMLAAGFSIEETGDYNRAADHTAAAADRFPFPSSGAAGLRCAFDGVNSKFHHPFASSAIAFHQPLSDLAGLEGHQTVQPALRREHCPADWSEEEFWRANFFAHWRLWPAAAIDKDYRFAFLPADTRLPDHTIWNHMQVVSALAGCAAGSDSDANLSPAFLKFQIGPVQEFIAQARSARDQWSGSYLLSWLMAAGLKALSAKVGPDSVIFPSLRNQPLFDLHWRGDIWDRISLNGRDKLWQRVEPREKERDLLTPNLPNVFLAVVPAAKAASLAQKVKSAIEHEFKSIANAVWTQCESAKLTRDEGAMDESQRRNRFFQQAQRFPTISWTITPWPSDIASALALCGRIPLSQGSDELTMLQRVEKVVHAAQTLIPEKHRDRRYYTNDSKNKLNNVGAAWATILTYCSWELDAVRQTRPFDGWDPILSKQGGELNGGWRVGAGYNKDSLTGREEAVAGGREWASRAQKLTGKWAARFKHDDWLGALSLIKRLWDVAYLSSSPWNLPELKMPNTHGLARHEPFSNDDDDREASTASEKYFAVLAFDGDEIGRWVSGDRAPQLENQLASYLQDGSQVGSLAYFIEPENGRAKDFQPLLKAARPVSPGYHLQFSEALADFALQCARPIVEIFDGRLIYCGGDDVVALLPADTAIACANALRMAFSGDPALGHMLQAFARKQLAANGGAQRNVSYFQKLAAEKPLFETPAPGFLARIDCVDYNHRCIPFVVPGPRASASIGIAIAHFKAPLQDVVREAQAAEKRAKTEIGRAALAVTLMKRSGEINQWGCKWDSYGLELYDAICSAMAQGELSSKFPHRVIELLEPYLGGMRADARFAMDESFARNVQDILSKDFALALKRQSTNGAAGKKLTAHLLPALKKYVEAIHSIQGHQTAKPQDASACAATRTLQALIGLCRAIAFAHRTRSGTDPAGNASTSSDESQLLETRQS